MLVKFWHQHLAIERRLKVTNAGLSNFLRGRFLLPVLQMVVTCSISVNGGADENLNPPANGSHGGPSQSTHALRQDGLPQTTKVMLKFLEVTYSTFQNDMNKLIAFAREERLPTTTHKTARKETSQRETSKRNPSGSHKSKSRCESCPLSLMLTMLEIT